MLLCLNQLFIRLLHYVFQIIHCYSHNTLLKNNLIQIHCKLNKTNKLRNYLYCGFEPLHIFKIHSKLEIYDWSSVDNFIFSRSLSSSDLLLL